MQQDQIDDISPFTKCLGASCIALVFLWGCATTTTETESVLQNAIEEVEEIEEGNDPDIEIVDSGIPQDCVETDERPTCHIKTRGLNFIPIKIKSEVSHFVYQRIKRPWGTSRVKRKVSLCLRPRGGSTREHVKISLSDCRSVKKSVRWFKKDGAYPGGYQLENMNSGKCIERVGRELLQRTCGRPGQVPRSQTWNFNDTPPFGSGDILESGTLERGCVLAAKKRRALMTDNCQNNANRRWYQSAI